MLVEHEDFGLQQARHGQRQRLPLAAGEKIDPRIEPLFEAQSPAAPAPRETACAGPRSPPCADSGQPALVGDGEIFLDGEAGRGAARRILKHPRHEAGAPLHRNRR